MNQRDKENLKFLLSSSPERLREWYNQVSDEDLIYASDLMDRYAAYLEWEIKSQQIERELAAMTVLTEAQAVIAAVRV